MSAFTYRDWLIKKGAPQAKIDAVPKPGASLTPLTIYEPYPGGVVPAGRTPAGGYALPPSGSGAVWPRPYAVAPQDGPGQSAPAMVASSLKKKNKKKKRGGANGSASRLGSAAPSSSSRGPEGGSDDDSEDDMFSSGPRTEFGRPSPGPAAAGGSTLVGAQSYDSRGEPYRPLPVPDVGNSSAGRYDPRYEDVYRHHPPAPSGPASASSSAGPSNAYGNGLYDPREGREPPPGASANWGRSKKKRRRLKGNVEFAKRPTKGRQDQMAPGSSDESDSREDDDERQYRPYGPSEESDDDDDSRPHKTSQWITSGQQQQHTTLFESAGQSAPILDSVFGAPADVAAPHPQPARLTGPSPMINQQAGSSTVTPSSGASTYITPYAAAQAAAGAATAPQPQTQRISVADGRARFEVMRARKREEAAAAAAATAAAATAAAALSLPVASSSPAPQPFAEPQRMLPTRESTEDLLDARRALEQRAWEQENDGWGDNGAWGRASATPAPPPVDDGRRAQQDAGRTRIDQGAAERIIRHNAQQTAPSEWVVRAEREKAAPLVTVKAEPQDDLPIAVPQATRRPPKSPREQQQQQQQHRGPPARPIAAESEVPDVKPVIQRYVSPPPLPPPANPRSGVRGYSREELPPACNLPPSADIQIQRTARRKFANQARWALQNESKQVINQRWVAGGFVLDWELNKGQGTYTETIPPELHNDPAAIERIIEARKEWMAERGMTLMAEPERHITSKKGVFAVSLPWMNEDPSPSPSPEPEPAPPAPPSPSYLTSLSARAPTGLGDDAATNPVVRAQHASAAADRAPRVKVEDAEMVDVDPVNNPNSLSRTLQRDLPLLEELGRRAAAFDSDPSNLNAVDAARAAMFEFTDAIHAHFGLRLDRVKEALLRRAAERERR